MKNNSSVKMSHGARHAVSHGARHAVPLFGQLIANPASQGMYFVAGFTLKAF